MNLFVNGAGETRYYLTSVPTAKHGKKLDIDFFDPGDGNGLGQYTLQVVAPPAAQVGPPTPFPGAGTVVPAVGVATSCTYNATPSDTKAPPHPNAAANCTVVTRDSTLSPANVYNGKWLRIEVQLDPSYTCSTDCWWSVRFTTSANALSSDRVVVSATIT